jgi:hypothetical protein
LCNKFKIAPEELSERLEAFQLNNQENIQNITIENLGRFEQDIQKSRNKKTEMGRTSLEQPMKRSRNHAPVVPQSFEKTVPRESTEATVTTNGFMNRVGSGETVMTLNGALGRGGRINPSLCEPLGNRAVVTLETGDFDGIVSRYRYMYTNLHDRARALDKQYVQHTETSIQLS